MSGWDRCERTRLEILAGGAREGTVHKLAGRILPLYISQYHDRANKIGRVRASEGVGRIDVGSDGERNAAVTAQNPVQLPTASEDVSYAVPCPALVAAERQLINTVALEIVRAVKARERLVIPPIAWKRMEHRSLVFAKINGFGECVNDADFRSRAQPACQSRLQRIVVGDLEGCHGVDVSPAVGGRADRRISIQQASPVSAADGRGVNVETQGDANPAGSHVACLSHPTGELMLQGQVVGLCIPTMERVGHGGCPHVVR